MGEARSDVRFCARRKRRAARFALRDCASIYLAIIALASLSSPTLSQEHAPPQPAAHAAVGSEPPQGATHAGQQVSTQGNLGHPYTLPAASRARMHECGVEWQRRKLSGEAGDEIWRVFASACLVAPEGKTRSVQ